MNYLAATYLCKIYLAATYLCNVCLTAPLPAKSSFTMPSICSPKPAS